MPKSPERLNIESTVKYRPENQRSDRKCEYKQDETSPPPPTHTHTHEYIYIYISPIHTCNTHVTLYPLPPQERGGYFPKKMNYTGPSFKISDIAAAEAKTRD